MKRISEQHAGISMVLTFLLILLFGFATTIYTPSLGNMATDLKVSNAQVQLSLTIFLISYGLAQFFIGSLIDSFGRYKTALYALLVFAVASIVIANTHNIYVIYLMRVVHGITVGAVVIAKRAYFIDMFTGEKLKKYLSIFSIIWAAGPIVSPALGGLFHAYFNWQFNFYFLAVFAVVFGVLDLVFSGETLKTFIPFEVKKIKNNYADMLKTPPFMLGIAMVGLAYSIIIVYNMTGPFVIENSLKLSPAVVGYSALVLGFGWLLGGIISETAIDQPFFKKVWVGIVLEVLVVVAMVVSVNFVSNIYSMLIFAFFINLTSSFVFNNYYSYCLTIFPKTAGIEIGVTGGLTTIIVSVFTYVLVYFIPAKNVQHLSYSYLIFIGLSVLVMFAISRNKDRNKGLTK